MNEIDKKILERIERSKSILGLETNNNASGEELIGATKLLLEVAKMIEREESLVPSEGRSKG